ncbi:MAG TPA: 5-(carboxyamino)imidazole ribonucleotide mutase [Nitrospirales bacterium]|jgi:phosphoribosylaminoimidazole carboxylase PurE protein
MTKPKGDGTNTRVGVYMGSASDAAAMEEVRKTLRELGIACEMAVASAHRSPERAHKLASTAEERGLEVLIVGAGGAAHLAGVMAANSILPVIGIPLDSSPLKGLDALLATVQMPGGIPVATMAIGKAGAKNAAILAAQILARKDSALAERLRQYKKEMAAAVEEASREVEAG